MKEVIVQVEDVAYEKFLVMISLCPQVQVIGTNNDECDEADNCRLLSVTIREMQQNKVLRHPRDYSYVMLAINQNVVKGLPFFYSPQEFVDFLKRSGFDIVPGRSTLYDSINKVEGIYPNWTFLDGAKDWEIQRRKNIVMQFRSAIFRNKRRVSDGFSDNH